MNVNQCFLHLLKFRMKCGTRDLPILLLIIREFFYDIGAGKTVLS